MSIVQNFVQDSRLEIICDLILDWISSDLFWIGLIRRINWREATKQLKPNKIEIENRNVDGNRNDGTKLKTFKHEL